MRLIDGSHLKKWILQRWETAYPHEDLPTREVLEQIDREISYKMIDIDPQLKWIPCSERLPEIKEGHESDVVLCYTDMEAYAFSRLQENIFGQCGFECEREDEYYTSVGKVIAWQPLPEPYKEDNNAV